MKLLAGDRALVTGTANGIGRGMAAALREEGAEVLGADIGDADIRCDLSSADGARQLAEEAIRRLGSVSIFVHCASPRRQESQTVLAVTAEEWRAMLSVNLDAAFILCQTLGRHMVEKKIKGRMLLVTSLHAESPRNLPHYSAAKAGETMLMKELAKGLGPHGIRVNAIAPGAIPGGGFNAPPGMVEKIPLRRFGTPADVAAIAVAVLSERFGAYVTGASIVVDGGIGLHNWIEPPHV
jgi:NAD(P)-dependent dehydrogenase (short-subunit alcohol dehydrogenase family)